MSPITFTDANFRDEVLNSRVPVVIDFWAPWCGPCRMLGPVIEELAAEYQGRVKIGKLNTDENPAASAALHIAAIPTVLFFKGGAILDRTAGVMSKAQFKSRIEKIL